MPIISDRGPFFHHIRIGSSQDGCPGFGHEWSALFSTCQVPLVDFEAHKAQPTPTHNEPALLRASRNQDASKAHPRRVDGHQRSPSRSEVEDDAKARVVRVHGCSDIVFRSQCRWRRTSNPLPVLCCSWIFLLPHEPPATPIDPCRHVNGWGQKTGEDCGGLMSSMKNQSNILADVVDQREAHPWLASFPCCPRVLSLAVG